MIRLLTFRQIGLGLMAAVIFVACNNGDSQQNKAHQQNDPNQMTIRDPHSFAEPHKAEVKHLDLEIAVDFDQKVIHGVATYEIKNKSGAGNIVFDTRGLTINRVTTGERFDSTDWLLGDEVAYLGQPLVVNIGPYTQWVHIEYTTSPGAQALQWLDPQQTAGKRHPFLFTQSQAILARTWMPCQDGPGIRFTYTANVKVPKSLLAVMSASNPQAKNGTGEYYFEMKQPIPSYLMALAVGDIEFQAIDDRTGVYAEPELLQKAAYEFDDMDEMLIAAEKLYGPYRWERYDVIVLPPSFPFGGMENPRLTFATPTIIAGDRSLTALIAHELAHSWSGNLVTNATWDDFWLNEGFTVYFEKRIMEEIYGEPYVQMLSMLGFQDLEADVKDIGPKHDDTKLKLNLKDRDPDEGMTNIAYEKGSLFLKTVENIVGREKFDAFLKEYFEHFAFKTMTSEKFVAYLNEKLIQNDKELAKKIDIDAWVFGPGIPDNAVLATSDRFEQVERSLADWQQGTPAKDLKADEWSTHEWLHFIRHLPDDLDAAKMNELDEAFGFTQSGNSEILCVWFEHVIEQQHQSAYGALEEFLITVGRRKFLRPLYAALAKTEDGLEMGRSIYQKARPNYHAVSTGTIDEILNWETL